MTTKMRTLRDFRNPIGCLILLAAFAAAAGCSTAESPSGSATNMNHVLPSGSSVAGWLVLPSGGTHASTATLDYIDGGGSSGCTQCHGSDLSGGISKVSCFGNPAGCHHTPVANWATPAVHGATAKKAPGSSGFASCQICHGNNFSGGGAQVACADCHGVPAPHPARPWRGPTVTHITTNTSNATVCAQCHFPGSPNNPANHPPTPAPAGTAPGCFNSTLCHGAVGAPHPLGNPAWVATPPAAEPHGNDAKATPGATTGFAYCQVCHGTGTTSPANFGGGSSGVSCYPCHGPNAPHAPAPWRASAGSTYNHTNTDTANAPVCALCHFPGSPNNPANHPPTPAPAGTAPGCFNSTLCHGAVGAPHPLGNPAWVTTPPAAEPHGNDAKATPGSTTGFAYCQVCHGTGTTSPANFGGGSSGVSCYPCHGPNAPHAPAPWRASAGSTYNHTNTDTANAPVCRQCHFPGSPNNPANHPPTPAPAGTPPDCFNNTLCHGAGGAPHPVPYNDSSHFTVTAATFPANCSACHDVSAPTVKSGPVCQTCHVAASPLTSLNCTSCHAYPAEQRRSRGSGVSEHRRSAFDPHRPEQRGDTDLLQYLPQRAGARNPEPLQPRQ